MIGFRIRDANKENTLFFKNEKNIKNITPLRAFPKKSLQKEYIFIASIPLKIPPESVEKAPKKIKGLRYNIKLDNLLFLNQFIAIKSLELININKKVRVIIKT